MTRVSQTDDEERERERERRTLALEELFMCM
jgi:hypothetical protein